MRTPACQGSVEVNSRREFLKKSSFGFGSLALGHLLNQEGLPAGRGPSSYDPLAPKQPHFPAQAKNVIFIFLQGGLSQVDSFDYKPALERYDGQVLPESYRDGLLLAQIDAYEAKLLASWRKFEKHGESGLEISDLFPYLSKHADDLAVIRSCYHEAFIHGPALSYLHTGSIRIGAASMGSWILYGLGSEVDNLPSYIVMADGHIRSSKSLFATGYLPAIYQGTVVSTRGVPFENLSPPPQIDLQRQQRILARVKKANRSHRETRGDDTRLDARMKNYELAFRMQMAAPELIDLAKEPEHVRQMYGLDDEPTEKFGRMCLLARRMVERGVRYVHLYSTDWDGHSECDKNHVENAWEMDKPVAGLLNDLKQRGLLESTLVVCSGEFGRTPVMQGKLGRDHNPYGFSTWLAGGGVRGGKAIGATDDLGFVAAEDKFHVNDLQGAMLGLLGLDHRKLTYRFQGLDRRLTGVGDTGHRSDELREKLTRA